MSRTFQPRRLCRMAARKVNDAIADFASIRSLEIPRVCQDYIEKYYFTDNLFCDDKMPPIDPEEFPYEFDEPFCSLSQDEYLSLMRYRGIAWFAYEFNHVFMHYYEVDRNNEPMCQSCMRNVSLNPDMEGRTIYCMENCFICPAEELIDNLQSLDMWCSNCHTTSLFKIVSWEGNFHNTFSLPTVKCTHRL